MDFGIKGRHALVCGGSGDIGGACALALAREGVDVTLLARNRDRLEKAAEVIARETGGKVSVVAADISTEEGRRAALEACPQIDILVNSLAPSVRGSFMEFGREDWIGAVDQIMVSVLLLMRDAMEGMIERRWGRVVNITSISAKILLNVPDDPYVLAMGARLGLTGAVASVSREVARHGITINNFLPNHIATGRLKGGLAAKAEAAGEPLDQFMTGVNRAIPAGRMGMPEEIGHHCAFMCSEQASFMTGQNLVIDGGSYPGVF